MTDLHRWVGRFSKVARNGQPRVAERRRDNAWDIRRSAAAGRLGERKRVWACFFARLARPEPTKNHFSYAGGGPCALKLTLTGG